MKKRLLIVGCTSKIARMFIESAKDTYKLYGTSNTGMAPEGIERLYKVDLSSDEAIAAFLEQVNRVTFDGVLFFAATYSPDPADSQALLQRVRSDLQVNAISTLVIARGLHYNKQSSVVFFGDAGLDVPKEGFSAYSLSKAVLENITKILAVELSGTSRVICLRPGPVYAREDHPDKEAYYSRNLTRSENPAQGLINTLSFFLGEPNLSMTGSVIDYDGGAYLKRR